MQTGLPSLTPAELKLELDGSNPPIVLDVREAHELEISALPNVVHIPLGQLPERMGELEPAQNLVVMCRVGGRSGQATAFLLGHGFSQVRNLSGGINAWARTVDPTLSEY